jgi:UDP-N-acetylmuramoyl-L-alanyl-D-glutamate--2,6-diaminopimelate ligase
MKLNDLLQPWCGEVIPDFDITGLQNDSRKIQPGDLFLAYPGLAADGRLYCQQAIDAGAVAVAYESSSLPDSFECQASVFYVPIPQLAIKLAAIASRFYDNPTNALSITGVTGTNGKTTIAYQLAQAYDLLGFKSAYIGTIGQGEVHALKPLSNTTPDALCLQSLLAQYKQADIKKVSMEVSSHALCQQRVDGIAFKQAIFSNLSHDHLDYHHTMQAYAQAKATLFSIPSLECVVVNHDDAYAGLMMQNVPTGCKKLTYGLQDGAHVRALDWTMSMTGTTFRVASPWGEHTVCVKTLGQFNLYNSLAVFSSLLADGFPINDVIDVMSKLVASPGRLELVAQNPCVIVDYAHTPDALQNVLSTLRQLNPRKLWLVFGCGGDRDKTKRPIMGKIASQLADVVVLTSDNPRTEDALLILKDIRAGMASTIAADVIQIEDRKEAIHHALRLADKHDIILIAGKGHEDYQQIGHQRVAFSDQTVVREHLAIIAGIKPSRDR